MIRRCKELHSVDYNCWLLDVLLAVNVMVALLGGESLAVANTHLDTLWQVTKLGLNTRFWMKRGIN